MNQLTDLLCAIPRYEIQWIELNVKDISFLYYVSFRVINRLKLLIHCMNCISNFKLVWLS